MTALLTEGGLKHHPLLEECSPEFLNHLEEFATDATFEAGDMIFNEGEYADRFYLINSGKVQLEEQTDEGRVPIQVIGAGDVLGWCWLYSPYEWHFSARALERCEAISLNAASLLIRAEEDPKFGYELMKRVGKQLIAWLQAMRKRLTQEIKANRDNH